MRSSALPPTGLLLAALALSGAARADDDPTVEAAAKALYDEGTAAMDRGDFAAACPKIEEVVRLKPAGVGAKLTVAECYEGAGCLASAWAAWGKAESAAAKAGQSARQEKAKKHVDDLAARVATLAIVVPPEVRAAAELEVRADGAVLGEGAFGVAVPVDRGTHAVRVAARGRAPWEAAIEAKDGEPSRVVVALGDALPPAPAPPSTTPAGSTARGRSYLVPALAGGAAVAGFALAAVSAAEIAHQRAIADAECDASKRCSDDGLAAVKTARTLDVVGAVGFGVGAAGAAGVLAWWLWPQPKGAAIGPVIAAGRGGLVVKGSF
jgi:hypothetical protein